MSIDEWQFDDVNNLSAKKIFDISGYKTAKKFGQNFLFDPAVNKKIISCASDLTGKTVLEVGSGPGGLTLEILKKNIKKLYVVELDSNWASVWKNLQPMFDGKLEVIECDALKFDVQTIKPDVIISNLPYNISTQLLGRWLKNFHEYDELILMFQKEVAERLYANPCTKEYGKLSVMTQWKSEVSKCFDLRGGSFFPPPKVKSTVVKFSPFKKKISQEKYDVFLKLLYDVFANRRKIILKPLSLHIENPEEILSDIGCTLNARAEEISVQNYMKILEKACLKKIVV